MDSIKRTTVRSVEFSRRHGTLSSSSSDPFYHPTQGSLHLSAHHVIFEKDHTTSANGSNEKSNEGGGGEQIERGGEKDENELWIPLSLLHSVTKSPPTFTGAPTPLILRTRDFYTYSLSLPTTQEVDEVFESLKNLCSAFSTGGLENRWAFFCHKEQEKKGNKKKLNGWEVYDPKAEYARMGVGSRSKAWRFSDINLDFNFCPSYPAQIVVPARISDTTLSYAVKYRSKCRIPGLVYLHWANYGSITRSSQPMVGITQTARSIQDEKLIEAIFSSHSQHSGSREAFTLQSPSSTDSFDPACGGIVYGAQATNVIIDARPTKNAYANSVKGAGTENMTFYKNCKKEYLGIDNIHVMRSSLNGVFQALAEAETTGHLDRLALRRTNWLSHLTNILDGVLIVIRTIHLSNSHVLVHCSDGWDRTSQLSALPQICLDPFYRTARGLAVLIEKDWIAYGHKFTDRSGHLCNDRIEFNQRLPQDATTQQSFLASVQKQFAGSSHQFKETCPVFQQFLDCIYQIMRQFPDRFEWNEELLRKLVWETYSGKSGSFLFNSEAERTSYKAREKTTSVWEEIFDLEEAEGSLKLQEQYRNASYNPSLDNPDSKSPSADQGVLLFDPQNVKYWYELFGRTDEEMNPPKPVMSPQSEERTLTEHQVVTSEEDDPVLHPLSAATSGLSLSAPPSSSSLQPSASTQQHSRSTFPAPRTNGTQPTTEQQLSETVASVQKFGWSAWKTVQKLGAEAAKQYKERTVQEQQLEQENGWSSSASGRGEDQGSVGKSEGSSGMWSRFSTISTNPWGTTEDPQPQSRNPLPDFTTPPPPSSSSSPSAQPLTSASYKPYQPRKPSAPHPTRQPSSALSINPWETIDREDALPTPLPRAEEPRMVGRVEEKKKKEEAVKSYGADPLGVL